MGISFNFRFPSFKICNWKKIYHVVVVNFKSQFFYFKKINIQHVFAMNQISKIILLCRWQIKKIRPSKEQIDLIHIDKKHVDLITAITNIKKKWKKEKFIDALAKYRQNFCKNVFCVRPWSWDMYEGM